MDIAKNAGQIVVGFFFIAVCIAASGFIARAVYEIFLWGWDVAGS